MKLVVYLVEVAVVGGGFSGLIFTLKLIEAGANVTLYEEHNRVGYPPHCTGLVSSRVVSLIGGPAFKSIISRYDSIIFAGKNSSIRAKIKGGIYKLDRVKLEEYMLEEALSRGVKIKLNTRVSRVSLKGLIEANNSIARYDAVILAEGYRGLLRKSLNIGFNGTPIYGVNIEYEGFTSDDKTVKVIFDDKLSGDFFSWILGFNETILIGSGSEDPAYLRMGLARLEKMLGLSKKIRVYGGPVILGPASLRLSSGKIHVVGDAGGLNKPLTGGGLYPNSLAGELILKLYRETGDLNKAIETALRIVASKLRKQYRIARLILKNPRLQETLISVGSELKIDEKIGELDFDNHEEMITKIVMNPSLIRAGVNVLFRDPIAVIKMLSRLLIS